MKAVATLTSLCSYALSFLRVETYSYPFSPDAVLKQPVYKSFPKLKLYGQ